MIRIVLIGNGFDLVHGLKTKYSDLMDYWKSTIKEKNHYNLYCHRSAGVEQSSSYYYASLNDQEADDPWIVLSINDSGELQLSVNPNNTSIYFQSLFDHYDELGYWSDLEEHYFNLLFQYKNSPEDIILINKEFEHLKKLLAYYLQQEIEDKIVVNDQEKTIVCNGKVFDQESTLYKILRDGGSCENLFHKTYFITFNYTSKILDTYKKWLWADEEIGVKHIPIIPLHIHGRFKEQNNPMIFGYGDDNSDKYKELEHLGSNELLKNFKTFQYLRDIKYREILGVFEPVDTEDSKIYVQIIGHSCGLCDKALLKTIFQHRNVAHIESVYYGNESKYFENLYNISRIFDDNTLMRERVVPLIKTLKI